VAVFVDLTTDKFEVARTWNSAVAPVQGAAFADDGCCVSFSSSAALVPGDDNGTEDVVLFVRTTKTLERVSVSDSGAEPNAGCTSFAVSNEGRFVFFTSRATNLVPGAPAGTQIYVRDRVRKQTSVVPLSDDGTIVTASFGRSPLAADGRTLVFQAQDKAFLKAKLPLGKIAPQVCVRDLSASTTECVTLGADHSGEAKPSTDPSVSRNGRYVVFRSSNKLLDPTPPTAGQFLYVYDRASRTATRVLDTDKFTVETPVVSDDGMFVAFVAFDRDQIQYAVDGDRKPSLLDPVSVTQVLVLNRHSGELTDVSRPMSGRLANDSAHSPTISSDGNVVAFVSSATDLVPGQGPPAEAHNMHTFVYEGIRRKGPLERVPVGAH
jgi:Tol biopolymer transport system component